jgi:endonuclease/exonuclease/phosphatase (EEP) superfamily protein YafD
LDPSRRIDHVFVSPGTQVADARYILSLASDHPAEVVEVEW